MLCQTVDRIKILFCSRSLSSAATISVFSFLFVRRKNVNWATHTAPAKSIPPTISLISPHRVETWREREFASWKNGGEMAALAVYNVYSFAQLNALLLGLQLEHTRSTWWQLMHKSKMAHHYFAFCIENNDIICAVAFSFTNSTVAATHRHFFPLRQCMRNK